MHIQESKHLLWELVTAEPTILRCFNIIESSILNQGVFCKIDDESCSDEFKAFLNEYYTTFIRESVRAMYTYGFIPFYLHQLEKKREKIPVVVPHGTFDWVVEAEGSDPNLRDKNDTTSVYLGHTLLQYRVQLTVPMRIKNHDIFVFPFISPCYNVSSLSVMHATISFPLSHVLVDYKHLRQAQIRRSHADAWNSTAKMICTFKPNQRVQDDPNASLMDFSDDQGARGLGIPGLPFLPHLAATNFWSRDSQIKQQFERYSAHVPDVYTLPRDHDIDQQPMLAPCEDIPFLLSKFQHDVAAVLNIPSEMVENKTSSQHDTIKKTMASSKLFSTNMTFICRYLSTLLKAAYEKIYGKDNVEFTLLPLSRLQIESVEDLKVLHEINAINPDMSIRLSSIMLGEEVEQHNDKLQLLYADSATRKKKEDLGLQKNELDNIKQQTKKPRIEDKQEKSTKDAKK